MPNSAKTQAHTKKTEPIHIFLQLWTIVVACGGVVAIQVERLTAKWQQGAGDFQSAFVVLTSEHKQSTYA